MNGAGIALWLAWRRSHGLSGTRVPPKRHSEAERVGRYPLPLPGLSDTYRAITCDTCGAAGWQGIDQRITWREEHA